MAKLLGNDSAIVDGVGVAWHIAGDAVWMRQPFTAVGGEMQTAYIWTMDDESRECKVCVWDLDGNLVAASESIGQVVNGEASGSISGTLNNGQEYYLGFVQNQAYYWVGRTDTAENQVETQANNFGTPAGLSLPGAAQNYANFRVWIDGTVGSGGGTTGEVAATLAGAVLSAGGGIAADADVANTLTGVTLAAAGTVGAVPARLLLTWAEFEVPSAEISGALAANLSGATASATGLTATAGSAEAAIAGVVSAASGVVSDVGAAVVAATVQNAVLSAAGGIEAVGNAAVGMQAVALSASGAVAGAITGSVAAVLGAATPAVAGTVAALGVVGVALASFTGAVAGAVGSISGWVSQQLQNAYSSSEGFHGVPSGGLWASLLRRRRRT